MSQSLGGVLVHVVFSTSHRRPLIDHPIRPVLHAYLTGVVNNGGCRSIQIGGTGDHLHALVSLGRTKSVADVVHVMKGNSSRWMIRNGVPGFAWQSGYAAFSVGASQAATVAHYIAHQVEHHRRRTFQEELRLFLDRHGVAYDERYLWD